MNKDTIIGYTLLENRAIAALLYKGIYYDTLCKLQANRIKIYEGLVSNYQSDSVVYSVKINTFTDKFIIADSAFKTTLNKYNREALKTKRYKQVLYPSLGLNLILLILLL